MCPSVSRISLSFSVQGNNTSRPELLCYTMANSHNFLRAWNAEKNRVWPQTFQLNSFFKDSGVPIAAASNAFRTNVQNFLQETAERQEGNLLHIPHWCTLLVQEQTNLMFPLYVVEEDVFNSDHHFCDECRCTNWSGHFVSKRKYHFIIPTDNKWNEALHQGALDDKSHLLHGVIHCNGYGHLLSLKGIQGDSKFLSGTEIMELWDRMTKKLRARKITIRDTTNLQIVHGATHGKFWFEGWGYAFLCGRVGRTQQEYYEALEALGMLPLKEVIRESSHDKKTKQLIDSYKSICKTEMITMKDVFKCMLSVTKKFDGPSSSSYVPGSDIASDIQCLIDGVLSTYSHLKRILQSKPCLLKKIPWPEPNLNLEHTFLIKLKTDLLDNESQLKWRHGTDILVVPLDATFPDLMQAVEAALRDTYFIADKLKVIELIFTDEEEVDQNLHLNSKLLVIGEDLNLHTELRFEGQIDEIKCECGSTDDRQRTLACNNCGVRQHPECIHIDDDNESTAAVFYCSLCRK